MANVTKRIENDTLYFELAGRVDTSNANQVEQAIQSIKSENSASNYIVDAAKLEFISSAGLRVILKLLKELKQLKIINVGIKKCPHFYFFCLPKISLTIFLNFLFSLGSWFLI